MAAGTKIILSKDRPISNGPNVGRSARGDCQMSRISKSAGCAIALVFAVGAARAAEVAPPADIAKAGKITYCAEFGNPPLGFYDENQVLGGMDVDIGTEIGKRMG